MSHPAFWWFPESSSTALAARITAAGPGHRLEVRVANDQTMTFRVVRAAGDAALATAAVVEPDINESFWCPPICPP